MKKFAALLLCVLMLACVSCAGEVPEATAGTEAPTQSPSAETDAPAADVPTEETTETPLPEDVLIYQAHRGLSTDYPENTVLAIEEAVKAGFGICEIDPNFTKDGRAILMHDGTVNRTCRNENGSAVEGSVSSYTYAEISKLDAGFFKGIEFKGTRVPLLIDAVKAAKAGGITVKIDNKIQGFSAAEQEIVFIIAEQYPETVGITCKSLSFVRKVIDRLPNAIIHYDGDVDEIVCKELGKIVGDNLLYIWYPVANVNKNICNMIKEYGKLGLWTVKSEAELEKAIALDADVIETNGEVRP